MNIIIRQARIIDPSSPFHQQQADILIQAGVIKAIGSHAGTSADKVIDLPGLSVSPGWLDIFAHFCDPGMEFRETLQSGTEAAAAGGYTDVLSLPNTTPVVHNKSSVEYIVQRSRTLPVRVHPIGAVTKNTEGKELSEMYDMHASGAVAFGDGTASIQSPGLLLKALQYIKAIDKVLIQVPEERSISGPGLMSEGIVSTRLGLPGKPAIAEEIMVARDIELAKYTGSKVHFTGISTARTVALIKKAKEEGVAVTCSVAPYHLCFCDEDLAQYDTNLKVNPPLRTAADRDALRAAVADGTVDCIASHHQPHDKDGKVVEFEYAKYGMIGLETAFAVVKSCLPDLPAERLVELFSTAPRDIFHLPAPGLKEGAPACLTLFLENHKWTVRRQDLRSASQNTPFLDKEVTGRPVGIVNGAQLFLNELN
ncbi:dihydroorotase [Paraflavisolibacter sp. H34]|uniref:dihydroorotase n=1 Tax=Huijunlia imazamoxiresistens TaxID=3127457 RepID=UPI003016D6E7